MENEKNPRDARILLVEDDEVVALYLGELIAEAGISIIGPVGRIADALALIEEQSSSIDAVILDINLHGELSYPIADELIKRGIHFIFTTGYGVGSLDAAYVMYPRCEKPFQEEVLLGALARALNLRTA